jgi:hypothetical protein
MKLTKEDLIKIIKEELDTLLEFASPRKIDRETDPFETGGPGGRGIYRRIPKPYTLPSDAEKEAALEKARAEDSGTGSRFDWRSPKTWTSMFGLEETVEEVVGELLESEASAKKPKGAPGSEFAKYPLEEGEEEAEKAHPGLEKSAKKKFPKDEERQDRYVYGAKRKMGWKPKRERN